MNRGFTPAASRASCCMNDTSTSITLLGQEPFLSRYGVYCWRSRQPGFRSAPTARRSIASRLQSFACRLLHNGSLGTKNDGICNPQTEKIGVLKAAFTVIDWNRVQNVLNRRVVTGDGLDSRELGNGFFAYRLGEQFHQFAERLELASFKPGSRHNQVPHTEGVGPPEEAEQGKVTLLRGYFMHRFTENGGANHRTSKSLCTHVSMSAACCGGERPMTW